MTDLTMVGALNLALREELARDDRVMILGEDVGKDGGIFRVTDGLLEEFGEDRVVDTPLAEAGIVGCSVGLAVGGMRPVPEMQFQGFSYFAFHQIENHVAQYRKRTRGRFPMPITIRMPYGAGIHALEHHSESRETYFAHTPGLKVVLPSGPRKARALLKAAIRDEDPVIFCEPAALYRRVREEVPDEEEVGEIGVADTVRAGDDLTVVAWGAMLRRAVDAAERLAAEDGTEAEVIDLQSVAPLDSDAVLDSVRRTGRAVVVHEAPRTLGVGAEVVARINDEALAWLEAPVKRVTGWDVHVPLFAREDHYVPDVERVLAGMRETLAY